MLLIERDIHEDIMYAMSILLFKILIRLQLLQQRFHELLFESSVLEYDGWIIIWTSQEIWRENH